MLLLIFVPSCCLNVLGYAGCAAARDAQLCYENPSNFSEYGSAGCAEVTGLELPETDFIANTAHPGSMATKGLVSKSSNDIYSAFRVYFLGFAPLEPGTYAFVVLNLAETQQKHGQENRVEEKVMVV